MGVMCKGVKGIVVVVSGMAGGVQGVVLVAGSLKAAGVVGVYGGAVSGTGGDVCMQVWVVVC